MPSAAILLLAAASAWFGATARLRHALALLVAMTVLVPGTLVVPNGVSSYVTLGRVVLVAVAVNVLRHRQEGRRERRAFDVTAVHVVFAVFVIVSLLFGVALAAPTTSMTRALATWTGILDLFVFFVVATACIREIDDDRWVLQVIGAVVAASAAIAVVEHFSGWSWGRFLFQGLRSQLDRTNAGRVLEQRGNRPRARAGAEFALQFAWVTVALLPALLATAVTGTRRWRRVAPWLAAMAGMAVVWSYSRSAVAGIALAVVTLWALSGFHRRIGVLLAAGLVLALSVVALSPNTTHLLSVSVDRGSIASRGIKLPTVLEVAAERPFTGVGLNGLDAYFVASTDEAYLRAYAELGVVGLVSLAVLFISALMMVARGLRQPRGPDRTIVAAALSGIVVLLVSGTTFDAFNLQGSGRPLWLLVGLGIAAAERSRGPVSVPVQHLTARRLAIPLAGVALGLLVAATAPSHAAAGVVAEVIPSASSQAADETPILAGGRLKTTACAIARQVETPDRHVLVTCRQLNLDPPEAFGLRVEAPSATGVRRALSDIQGSVGRAVPGFRLAATGPIRSDRATLAKTAPALLGILGLAIALLVPDPRRPRNAVVAAPATLAPAAAGR